MYVKIFFMIDSCKHSVMITEVETNRRRMVPCETYMESTIIILDVSHIDNSSYSI